MFHLSLSPSQTSSTFNAFSGIWMTKSKVSSLCDTIYGGLKNSYNSFWQGRSCSLELILVITVILLEFLNNHVHFLKSRVSLQLIDQTVPPERSDLGQEKLHDRITLAFVSGQKMPSSKPGGVDSPSLISSIINVDNSLLSTFILVTLSY